MRGNRTWNLYGLMVRKRRMLSAFLLIVFGISMIFWGAFTFYVDQAMFANRISDEEIIERAKKLGMVDLKEYLRSNDSDSDSRDLRENTSPEELNQ